VAATPRTLRVSVRVPAEIRAERGGFVATCFLVDRRHRAAAKDEALRKLARFMERWLSSRLEERTIDTLLRGHGFRAVDWPDATAGGPYVDISVVLLAF
jgi:hypothetical protein